MDLLSKASYLDGTMMRRLLTLLAVLTGFAVIGEPVQAQPSQSAATMCETFAQSAAALCATPAELAQAIAVGPRQNAVFSGVRLAEWSAPAPAPIYIRIDRARE